MTVDITTPNGTIINYRDVDVVEAEANGDEIGQCDHCGATEIAELLIPHHGVRYCEHCDGDMYRR